MTETETKKVATELSPTKATPNTKKQEKVVYNMPDWVYYPLLAIVTAMVATHLYFLNQAYDWGMTVKPAKFKYLETSPYLKITAFTTVYYYFQRLFIWSAFDTCLYKWCPRQATEVEHRAYARNAGRTLHQLVSFGISVVWGYRELKHTVWLPTWLGGLNENASIHAAMLTPSQSMWRQAPTSLYCYLCFTFGYHVQHTIEHFLFKNRRKDHRELTIHHMLTFCLYVGFLLGNFLGIGAVLCFLHDTSEFFAKVSKFAHLMTGHQRGVLSYLTYFVMLSTWGCCRLAAVDAYLYEIYYHYEHPNPELKLLVTILLAMLGLLAFMNHLWFVKLFVRLAVPSEMTPAQGKEGGDKKTN